MTDLGLVPAKQSGGVKLVKCTITGKNIILCLEENNSRCGFIVSKT